MHLFININPDPINETKEKLPECDLPILVPVHFSCEEDKTGNEVKKGNAKNISWKKKVKQKLML